jgi:hypothetical protein
MNDFLEKYKLLKLIQKGVENLNRTINIEETRKFTKDLSLKKNRNLGIPWQCLPIFRKKKDVVYNIQIKYQGGEIILLHL